MIKKHPASPKPAFPFAAINSDPRLHPVIAHKAGEGTWTLVASYIDDRLYRNDREADEVSTFLAAGRLELIFRVARDEMAGRFDIADIEQLLMSFGPDFFMPGEDAALSMSLAAEHGWDSDEDVPLSMRSLFEKLNGLTSTQSLALADVLERVVHVHLWSGKHKSIASAINAAGLLLCDVPSKAGSAS